MIFWRLSNNLSKIHDSSLIVGGRVFFGFLVVERVVIAVVVCCDVFFVVSSGQVSAWSEQQSRKSWHDESQKQSRPLIFAPIFDNGRFQSLIRQILYQMYKIPKSVCQRKCVGWFSGKKTDSQNDARIRERHLVTINLRTRLDFPKIKFWEFVGIKFETNQFLIFTRYPECDKVWVASVAVQIHTRAALTRTHIFCPQGTEGHSDTFRPWLKGTFICRRFHLTTALSSEHLYQGFFHQKSGLHGPYWAKAFQSGPKRIGRTEWAKFERTDTVKCAYVDSRWTTLLMR